MEREGERQRNAEKTSEQSLEDRDGSMVVA